MRIYLFILLLLFACAKAPTGNVVLNDDKNTTLLYVDPASVQDVRQEFVEKLKLTGKNLNKRALYEEYVDKIGANGILDGIEIVYDKCHGEAHDLGKVIFAKVRDISTALRICSDRCYTGCMHGVLMEAFSSAETTDDEGHIDFEKFKPVLHNICFNNTEMKESYGPGECAHGVGHALMFLSGYQIQKALDACANFDDQKMEYYCADGGYMEYLLVHDDEDKSMFYPCDTFAYPATCMRTKVGLVGKKLFNEGKTTIDIIHECEKLEGKFRLGCFHGLGTSHSKILALGRMKITELCSHGSDDEQTACIEGAVEFMGKYFEDEVQTVCNELDGNQKEICLAAGRHKLYSLDKDLSLYLR